MGVMRVTKGKKWMTWSGGNSYSERSDDAIWGIGVPTLSATVAQVPESKLCYEYIMHKSFSSRYAFSDAQVFSAKSLVLLKREAAAESLLCHRARWRAYHTLRLPGRKF